ncbi:MAG: peptidoglycan-binding domain-containing protein [Alphaproteobacteria bacterium]
MTRFARQLVFSVATACFALTLGASPALAKTTHHHKKHHVKAHHVVHHTKGSSIIRIAQEHLSSLGYYSGKIDGVMGAKTKAAIKKFQRDQGLKADGVLGRKTMHALEVADTNASHKHELPTHDAVVVDPNAPVAADYVPLLNGGTKILPNRFAGIEVSESGNGPNKQYNVNLNGQPLFAAKDQPAIIGISPTYNLGDEDAIVFTTYTDGTDSCPYGSHVLVLNSVGSKMLDVENCTRNYQARVDNGSLYISFGEPDDKRDIGATWRLSGVNLERL